MNHLALIFLYVLLLNLLYFQFSIKNSIIALISFSFYLLPFFLIIKIFKNILNIKDAVNSTLKQKIWNKKLNFYTKTKKNKKIKKYKILLLIILFYFLLIPQYYSKSYVSKTVKYNYIHSLFLLVIQTILIFLYKKMIKNQILRPLFKNSFCSLIILSLLFNLFLILYCLFSSINNIYVEIPFFTAYVKIYKFMGKTP